MQRLASTIALVWALGSATQAFAWGEPGHQLTGSIAYDLISEPGHANAKSNVDRILNHVGHHTLSDTATGADCVRDVAKSSNGFKARYVTGATPGICRSAFPETDKTESDAMIAYVSNNWSQCDYHDDQPGSGQCHATYHFEDIPFQRGRYAQRELSTSRHDIVSAINEAIFYQKQGRRSPGAVVLFSNDREALFILAHLIGDLHQPLHVGAVYLDEQGQVVDPHQDSALAKRTFTVGGNAIVDASSAAAKPPNRHHDWDTIAKPNLDSAKA